MLMYRFLRFMLIWVVCCTEMCSWVEALETPLLNCSSCWRKCSPALFSAAKTLSYFFQVRHNKWLFRGSYTFTVQVIALLNYVVSYNGFRSSRWALRRWFRWLVSVACAVVCWVVHRSHPERALVTRDPLFTQYQQTGSDLFLSNSNLAQTSASLHFKKAHNPTLLTPKHFYNGNLLWNRCTTWMSE